MILLHTLLLVGPLLACAPMPANSMQDPGPPAQYAEGPPFSDPDYLEQLVAPIALYPDSLLTHVFMAATYPIEVVEASRWCERNPDLVGDELEYALLDYDWDPSIKALCGFPQVLQRMSENLDWTQDLGDAVLETQQDLLAAVQRMRHIAFEAGTLESTPQQTVYANDGYIEIRPYDPGIVYVPYYSPTVVFQGWHFPHWHYPRFFLPHPGWGALAFHSGVHWGHHLFGHPNWHNQGIDIDIDIHNKFVNKTSKTVNKFEINNYGSKGGGGKAKFKHNPEHRRGVNYKSTQVAERFGADASSTRVSRDRARGRTSRDANELRGGDARSGERGAVPRNSTDRDDNNTSRGDRTTSGTPKSGGGGRGAAHDSDVGVERGTSRSTAPNSTRDSPRNPPRSPTTGSSRSGEPSSTRDAPRETPRSSSTGAGSSSGRSGSTGSSGRSSSSGRSTNSGVFGGSKDPDRDRSASQRGASSRGKSSSTGRSTGSSSSGNRGTGGRSSGGKSSGGRSGGGRSGGGRP